MRDAFDPTLEETTILNVSAATKRKASMLILSCEACSDDAEIPFDYVLDWVTGLDPAVTDYVLNEPAKCPKCRGDVTEKTLIEPRSGQLKSRRA
jgi:hypothetical protein